MKINGIYAIKHILTDRMYIGSSSNLSTRIRQHFSDLRCNRHANTYLQRSFNKHGEDEFEWTILELVDNDVVLLEREQQWINKLGTTSRKKGYNIAIDTKSPMKGRKQSEKCKKAASERCGEKSGMAKANNELINEIFNLHFSGHSQKQISQIVGLHHTNISYILKGKSWKHLRLCDAIDKSVATNNKSGCTGVYLQVGGKWKAEIIRNGEYHNLGCFTIKNEAIAARKEAERECHGI